MAEYDNSHSVIIFKNERKTEDWHGDYQGTWTGENGEEYYATGHIKEGKNGKYLRIKRGKLKQAKPGQSAPQKKPQSMYEDPLSDDIPF